jgi:hypothetical protein
MIFCDHYIRVAKIAGDLYENLFTPFFFLFAGEKLVFAGEMWLPLVISPVSCGAYF